MEPLINEFIGSLRAKVAEATEQALRGAMRAMQEPHRIRYCWNGTEYGYFVRDENGVSRWAGLSITDAISMLGQFPT